MRIQIVAASFPVPRPSSTVVLVRDAAAAPEVFMVKRHEQSAFGSAYAFPGGVLEDADKNVHDYCSGLTPVEANRILDLDTGGLDYFSAAVRELFEESGVLLGRKRRQNDALDQARIELNNGLLAWDEFVAKQDVVIPCNLLHYFSFWITPPDSPKRYTTRFFLAELPNGQQASHCGGELTDSCWMPAQAILDAHTNKTMRVYHPTRRSLQCVARFDSTRSLCEWGNDCAQNGVICDQPAYVPESMR